MKNTKALFLIILGTFLLATGFAFANDTYNKLASGNPFGDARSASVNPSLGIAKGLGAPAYTVASTAPAKPAGETVKKFIGDNARNMLLGGIGAYIGFALGGPIGLLIGGLLFLAMGTL
ncbi:MAG: hypothetical protein Q8O90_08190 [Elusimicrobiota bacterium]|nr:hypothetical protein [Elusimicrobiota bacterium]